jgi:tetratricopeptide (TPR) repeat protein
MSATSIKKIEAAYEQEDWPKARQMLQAELKRDPEDHWFLTTLASTYYEERDYEKALELSQRAMKLASGCPLVRWDYACALDMLDRTDEAIKQWRRLVKAGPKAIANDPCGEGTKWAASLVNDSRYRLAVAYADEGEISKAVRYIRNYLRGRKSGIASIYDEDDAQVRLKGWLAKKNSPSRP